MPIAGSIAIRPTREDAERDPKRFFDIIAHLRHRKELPLKVLAEVIGDTSANPEVTAHRRLKNENVSDAERSSALRQFYDDRRVFSGRMRDQLKNVEDAIYYAFLSFADIKETSQDKARARLEGTYRFWRQSVDYADEYVFGKIVFGEDTRSRALAATMVQQKRGDNPVTEVFKGYGFRVSHMYLMLLRDLATNDVRITFFTKRKQAEIGLDLNDKSPFKGRMLHNVWLDGYAFGIDSSPFFAPLHLSLVDNVDELAELDSKLDIIAHDDPRLPPRVLRKLQRMGPLRVL